MIYEIGLAAIWLMVWVLGFIITVFGSLFVGGLLFGLMMRLIKLTRKNMW